MYRWRKRLFSFPTMVALLLMAGVAAQAGLTYARQGAETTATPVRVAGATMTPDPVSPVDVATLGVVLDNRAGRQDGLVVETQVRAADGRTVLEARQSGIGVDPASRRAIYWEWRVPQRVEDGVYTVDVRVYGAGGRTLYDRAEGVASFSVLAPPSRD